jgi:hypothetical protein
MSSSAFLTFYRALTLTLLLFAAPASLNGGTADSAAAHKADTGASPYSHSPRKATILSAVLPGAGQFYNHKYWKIPVIYAAAGTSIFFISYNQKIYESYRRAYTYRIDGDTNTTDFEYAGLTDETVRSERQRFLRYRDISILALIATYALNIIDANVDAHLFAFDVDDDLSFRWQPSYSPTLRRPAVGFTLTYNLH